MISMPLCYQCQEWIYFGSKKDFLFKKRLSLKWTTINIQSEIFVYIHFIDSIEKILLASWCPFYYIWICVFVAAVAVECELNDKNSPTNRKNHYTNLRTKNHHQKSVICIERTIAPIPTIMSPFLWIFLFEFIPLHFHWFICILNIFMFTIANKNDGKTTSFESIYCNCIVFSTFVYGWYDVDLWKLLHIGSG